MVMTSGEHAQSIQKMAMIHKVSPGTKKVAFTVVH
jgi:hypothetical protein